MNEGRENGETKNQQREKQREGKKKKMIRVRVRVRVRVSVSGFRVFGFFGFPELSPPHHHRNTKTQKNSISLARWRTAMAAKKRLISSTVAKKSPQFFLLRLQQANLLLRTRQVTTGPPQLCGKQEEARRAEARRGATSARRGSTNRHCRDAGRRASASTEKDSCGNKPYSTGEIPRRYRLI